MGELLGNIASCIREELWRDKGIAGKAYRWYRESDDAFNVRRLAPRVIQALFDSEPKTTDEVAASVKPRVAVLRYTYGGWGYYYTLASLEHLEEKGFVASKIKHIGDKQVNLYELTDEGKQTAKKCRRLRGS